MNKPCSERAWGPLLPSAPTTPPPQIKEIWVSAWLLPLYVHPLLTPGIILTRVGLTPCKTPSQPLLLARLACWTTGSVWSSIQPSLSSQRPWGKNWEKPRALG